MTTDCFMGRGSHEPQEAHKASRARQAGAILGILLQNQGGSANQGLKRLKPSQAGRAQTSFARLMCEK